MVYPSYSAKRRLVKLAITQVSPTPLNRLNIGVASAVVATIEQLSQLLEVQQQLPELLAQREKAKHKTGPLVEDLKRNIQDFNYYPDNDITFNTYYRRYEDMFKRG